MSATRINGFWARTTLFTAMSLSVGIALAGCSGSPANTSGGAATTLSSQPDAPASMGTTAPPLRARLLKDVSQGIALEDFKGKFVVVDFWATWCAPCRAEVPALADVYKKNSGDSRFAMLSISLDTGPSAPRDFAAKNGMAWNQGFAGSASERTQILEQWGVSGIPAVFLIGPDGKILKKDIHGDEVASVVKKALGN